MVKIHEWSERGMKQNKDGDFVRLHDYNRLHQLYADSIIERDHLAKISEDAHNEVAVLKDIINELQDG